MIQLSQRQRKFIESERQLIKRFNADQLGREGWFLHRIKNIVWQILEELSDKDGD